MERVANAGEHAHPPHDLRKVFGVEELANSVCVSARGVAYFQNLFEHWEEECWRLYYENGDVESLTVTLTVQLENVRNLLQVLVERLKNPPKPNLYDGMEERRRPMNFDDLSQWAAHCLVRYRAWSDCIPKISAAGVGQVLCDHMTKFRSILEGLLPLEEDALGLVRVLLSGYRVEALNALSMSEAYKGMGQGIFDSIIHTLSSPSPQVNDFAPSR